MPVSTAIAESTYSGHPLCVDLDGSLVKSDTSSMPLAAGAAAPAQACQVPFWLARGRAALKSEVASAAPHSTIAHLPYNATLLRYLQTERSAENRPIYLATGADSGLANRVAAHLGIFDGVLASDGVTNLTHANKLASLEQRFGAFDYMGNSPRRLADARESRGSDGRQPDAWTHDGAAR